MEDKASLLLVMGAMVIFSMLLMNINKFLLQNDTTQVGEQMNHTAAALSQGLIGIAKSKAFDQATVGGKYPQNVPTVFSATLGPENGETPKNYDDFDDYNGYATTDTTSLGVFHLSVTVTYVSDTDFSQVSAIPTTHKRMTVDVYNPTMKDTLALTYIKSYY
ncbi:MAG TPA: hypothetical protein VKA08_15040 [Balneolales bacterium]|nr:hypothetical protein [Balneolales bacterium]